MKARLGSIPLFEGRPFARYTRSPAGALFSRLAPRYYSEELSEAQATGRASGRAGVRLYTLSTPLFDSQGGSFACSTAGLLRWPLG